MNQKNNERIYLMSMEKIYHLYLQKIIRKNRTEEELIQIIEWLTGYNLKIENNALKKTVKTFFDEAPNFNERSNLITGVICGVRIEEIIDPTMKKIRYLDKLVDELAKGKALDKIYR